MQYQTLRHLGLVFGALLIVGCSGDDEETPAVTDGPTYWQDVEPILAGKCVMCHQDGGVGPFAFDSYENVARMRDAISLAVSSKVMPPWSARNSCGQEYLGDWTLSDSQIETITDWAQNDAPEGDDADPQEAVQTADTWVSMSRADLEIEMPVAYTPTSAPDDYRCFVVPWPETETSYVTGFVTEPGNRGIVHHVISYLAPPDRVEEALAKDAEDEAPGYPCYGSSGLGGETLPWLGAWAPGGSGGDFPDSTGILVQPGSAVILQVHYNVVTSDPTPDRSRMIFQLEPTLPNVAALTPFVDPGWVFRGEMDIPANEVTTLSFTLDISLYLDGFSGGNLRPEEGFTIHQVNLHMHKLGQSGSLELIRASGEEICLLGIDDWDFNWQNSYRLKAPLEFSPGDQLRLTCTWDNTAENQPTDAPPRDVTWGDGTYDEMCLGILYLSQPAL